MFKLVIQDDEGKTTVVPLIRDEITIGRKEGNTIRLTERNVSRRHARIVRSNGAVAIEDLGSYNGVRVNGTRIAQRTSLSVSDRVQIGDYLIELKAEGVEHAGDDGKTQPIERMDPNYIEAQMGTATTMPPSPAGAAGAAAAVPLADTDPAARAIPGGVPHAAIGQTSGHARLVVLSSNFAGQEWELSRPQMIIGRTDDNDLVVNHRSISRNHAKFVREPDTGRYTISDLQSSNGVRVNGEEYGKVELRRGDVIDLGHVRLRFVEPGEDFVFGRDAQIADVPTGGKNKTLMLVAAVALLAVGGVAIFMLTRGDGKGGTKPEDGSNDNPIAVVIDAAPPVMVAPDATATAIEPENDFAKQLAACRDLRASEDWMAVLKCANEMLKTSPTSQDVKDLADQAKREAANKLAADTFNTAVGKNDYQGAIAALKKIPADSVYWDKAKAAHDKMRDDYVKDQEDWANARAAKNDCKSIDARKKQVFWPEAKQALDAVKCERGGGGTTVAQPEPECRKDGDCKSDQECKSNKCVVKPASAECEQTEFDALIAEAREAGKANQWSKMLSRAEAANKCIPNKPARQLALMAACRLGNRDKAQRYWKEFENNTQMIQTCIGVVK